MVVRDNKPAEMRLRCLIVDDNAGFLEAARGLLEGQGIEIVGVASTSAEAIRRVLELRPDVTLVDVNLGEENGADLARRLLSDETTPTRVILISTYAQDDLAEALPSGSTFPFMSKARLSAMAIRAALETTADGDTAD